MSSDVLPAPVAHVCLSDVHGGYDPAWPGYGADFALDRENSSQEWTVLAESWVQNVYRLTPDKIDGTSIVVDLGACFGAFTLLAATMGAEQVHAYEPDPVNATRLRDHLRQRAGMYASVRVYEEAVGISGAPYRMVGEGVTAQAVWRDRDNDVLRRAGLWTIVDRAGGAVDFMKVDVEGAEYDLFLDDKTDAIAEVRYIAMEWHGLGLGYDDGEQVGALVRYLLHTHHVEVSGDPQVGGMLYARRR